MTKKYEKNYEMLNPGEKCCYEATLSIVKEVVAVKDDKTVKKNRNCWTGPSYWNNELEYTLKKHFPNK